MVEVKAAIPLPLCDSPHRSARFQAWHKQSCSFKEWQAVEFWTVQAAAVTDEWKPSQGVLVSKRHTALLTQQQGTDTEHQTSLCSAASDGHRAERVAGLFSVNAMCLLNTRLTAVCLLLWLRVEMTVFSLLLTVLSTTGAGSGSSTGSGPPAAITSGKTDSHTKHYLKH